MSLGKGEDVGDNVDDVDYFDDVNDVGDGVIGSTLCASTNLFSSHGRRWRPGDFTSNMILISLHQGGHQPFGGCHIYQGSLEICLICQILTFSSESDKSRPDRDFGFCQ